MSLSSHKEREGGGGRGGRGDERRGGGRTRSSKGIKVHRRERRLFLSHREAEHQTNSIPMHHVQEAKGI